MPQYAAHVVSLSPPSRVYFPDRRTCEYAYEARGTCNSPLHTCRSVCTNLLWAPRRLQLPSRFCCGDTNTPSTTVRNPYLTLAILGGKGIISYRLPHSLGKNRIQRFLFNFSISYPKKYNSKTTRKQPSLVIALLLFTPRRFGCAEEVRRRLSPALAEATREQLYRGGHCTAATRRLCLTQVSIGRCVVLLPKRSCPARREILSTSSGIRRWP